MPGNGSSAAVAAEKLPVCEGEALQDRGLELASFLIADRCIALEVLGSALNKLAVQRSRELKRNYWRRRYLKRKITRMVRNESDTLQWLIYFEAERHEREQEQAGKQTEREMMVRYIKHLVQVTTAMSSFYVNVGINRLLRNYSTPEVRQVYEWVTQHFPSDQEYRKVKADLMGKLKTRFGSFLRTSAGPYGEQRFETLENQASWADLVRECLNAFTPWSTTQACGALFNAGYRLGSLPQHMHTQDRGTNQQDLLEANRCHVFLDPTCYSQLTGALGLNSAEDKLCLPRFFMNTSNGGARSSRKSPMAERLTEGERRRIGERLSAESERRRRVKPTFLKILVDDRECARLSNCQGSNRQCQIEEGANLIEVSTEYEGEDLLLAAHWIEYTQSQGIAPAAATVDLGDGRELLLEITPEKSQDDVSYAVLRLQCRAASAAGRVKEHLQSQSFWFHSLPKYAFLSLLVFGIGWSIANFRTKRELASLNRELARQAEARASLEKELKNGQSAPVEAYLLVPDESQPRGEPGSPEPVIKLSPHAAQVLLEIPVPVDLPGPYRVTLRQFLQNREILAENFPKLADSSSETQLKFVLPAAFVEAGQHYVLELNTIVASGHSERVRTFTFYVSQQ